MLNVFVDRFMTTKSILKHNTSNKSRDYEQLKGINEIVLRERINEISK